MKFCPHCGKELSAQTAFCPNCGKSLNLSENTNASTQVIQNIPNMPTKFWITLAGTVVVLILSFFNWISISLGRYELLSFNLYDLLSTSNNSTLRYLFYDSSEFRTFRGFITFLVVSLVLAFVLLIISLINYRSQNGTTFAYIGFGISSFVSVALIISGTAINSGYDDVSLTVFPFLVVIVAVLAIVLLYRLPESTRSYQTSYFKASSMYWECSSCGELNGKNAINCINCGTSPKHGNRPSSNSKAIAPVALGSGKIRCSRCDAEQGTNREFCIKCGSKFAK